VFETALRRELSPATRRGERVGLLMLDIDHFKHYNDNYGHQAGDEALKNVAHALQGECRDYDTAARHGGEEFAVIVPGCTPKQCRAAAERLRKAVAKVAAEARSL
jgi:diguanylate cyclase (GGDEF)-like protein